VHCWASDGQTRSNVSGDPDKRACIDSYVGIEREVALHPQTMLVYEMNGQLLTPDHGAPLRLVTPLKYGIKQIKQIGRISYADTRPHDYWYEYGYDYDAGL
jgi:DMSO/TMAO reductase YedYZ molybdopterin-dependent catalytic subunit